MQPHSYTLARRREEALRRAEQRVTADLLFAEQTRSAALDFAHTQRSDTRLDTRSGNR